MCGIAGVFAYRSSAPPVDREELLRIRDAMLRRGPDGEGLWLAADNRVGLAHRRLAIIDLTPSGAQPMTSVDGRFTITFNGEIYNYRELRKELETKGYRFRTNSDTEVILNLYADRGKAVVHALRGMYAFGIWDDRNQGLFLARDPLGIKPLYYADDGETLRFASQVKALLRGGGFPVHPEPAGYVGFLTWGCVPEPFTLYREIRALPAGSHMWVGATGRRPSERFFNIRDEYLAAEEVSRSSKARGDVGEIVLALQDSVSYHMTADVPVAAFLSAGLDSSTTVALASITSKHNLRTVTLGFKEYQGGENDETSLAAQVSSRFGAIHETRWITRDDFEENLQDILEAMDQPSTDGVNTYLVSREASKAGMKVALSGLGGDEVFAGYPSFRHVRRIRQLARATRIPPATGRRIRSVLSPMIDWFASPKYAGILEYGQTFGGAYLLRRALFMPWEIGRIIEPDVAKRGWEDLQTLEQLDRSIEGLSSDRSIVSTLEMDWYMRNQLLRDSDWAGMANSLEIRVPYVDPTFLKSVLPIVACDDITKTDIATALSPSLPSEVLERGKTGFLVPVQQWCAGVSGNRQMDRGLRGWARIVIGRSLDAAGFAATGSRSVYAIPVGPSASSSQFAQRVAASAAKSAYTATNQLLSWTAALVWPGARPGTAQNVCIFRIGNIGDVVCALPAIRRIRNAYPDAHLTVLTSPGRRGMPGALDVLEDASWIDELRVYYSDEINTLAKRWKLVRELRSQRFDVWVDLPNNLTTTSRQFRDLIFTRLAGVAWARGWRIDTLRWAAQAQSEQLQFPNEVERMLRVVEQAGFGGKDVEFGLSRSPSAEAAVEDLLQGKGALNRRLIAIAPGAKRSTNLWDPERFVAVGLELSAMGYRVVLIGGRSDQATCDRIARDLGPGAFSLAGRLSVTESSILLARCELVVCVDSGVQHLASAVGTPVLSLFSSWQMRGKWRPYGDRVVVIQKWVPCHTCLLEVCPNANRCMTAIEVKDVMFHARRLLSAGSRQAKANGEAEEHLRLSGSFKGKPH